MNAEQKYIFYSYVIRAMMNGENSFSATWSDFNLQEDAFSSFILTENFLDEILTNDYDVEFTYPEVGNFPNGIIVTWDRKE